SQGSTPIPNPTVYLNYLAPSIANDYEITRDVGLVTLGALIWDILSSIPEDYKLIQTGKVSPVLFAYFLARPFSLIMVVLSVLLKTGPVSNCTLIAMLLVGCQVISSAAASYLFLKRVHAVYHKSKIARHIFSFLWFVGVGTSCAVFHGALHDYSEIANTKHCVRHSTWSALSIAFLDPVLFDTLVYFAITYKILTTHWTRKEEGWRYYCLGKALPYLSRAVLQGGQQYYLITTGINVSRFAFSLSPAISPTLQVILSNPAVSLTSIMACRVCRNLTIGSLRDSEGTGGMSLTAPKFADGQAVNVTFPTSAGRSMLRQSKSDSHRECSIPKEEV
ncbi:hypothetical protein V8B97DRAFT_2027368, partial [Scleroderma yunnanense]